MFPNSFPQPGQETYVKIMAVGNYIVTLPPFHFVGQHAEILVEILSYGAAGSTPFSGTWPSDIWWELPSGTYVQGFAAYLQANTGRTVMKVSGSDQVLIWTNDTITKYGKLV